jgi:8-oxo-dGTP pyrophosphatase MutT (NUDIX family)
VIAAERALARGHVLERLAARPGRDLPLALAPRRAAVAAVIRWRPPGPEVLLMKRAERPGDRWSGHVSFPGGRHEPADVDLLATAVRETREEVAVDLEAAARPIGRLDDVMAVARGRIIPMAIRPFVFELTEEVTPGTSDEAEACFWFPLAGAWDGSVVDAMVYRAGPIPLHFPCYRWEGHVIWGLTHKMLETLFEALR